MPPRKEKKVTEYDNTNTGYLTPNARKENEDDEDSFGKLDIAGFEYHVKAYLSEDAESMDLDFQKTGTRGDNKGRGTLKKVTDRKTDKYPHWRGTVTTAGGDKFEVAGWRKIRDGKPPLLSLRVSKPRNQSQEQKPAPQDQQEEFPL